MIPPRSLISAAVALLAAFLLPACSQAESDSTYKTAASAEGFDHGHQAFTKVLSTHVGKGKVDYAALKKRPSELNAYLDTLAAVSKKDYDRWSKQQQMAFLINLYNAATLKLIIDHYPVKSIKDIGSIIKGPWKQEVVRLWGKKVTLDHVEHDLLRPGFKDPRVHFAVNCASIGCPDLRNEAFQASKLEDQLDEQARGFLRDSSRNRLDAKNKTLHLSLIFKWFKEDFVNKSGSVEKFVAPYFEDADRSVIQRGGLEIEYTDYNWNLNKQ
jgi:hypothetical protein